MKRVSRAASRKTAGYGLLEALAALIIVGIAVLIAANGLTAHGAMAARLAVRQELLRAAEVVLEGVRGGVVPLATGPVALPDELASRSLRLHVFAKVTPEATDGLYRVDIRSSSHVHGRPEQITLISMVWRP